MIKFSALYKSVIRPLLFSKPAENAHYFTFGWIKRLFKVPGVSSIAKSIYDFEDKRLEVEAFGLKFKNLQFSMYIMGQRGNKILNRKRGELIWTNDTNIDADLANGLWNGEGTSDKYPSASGLRRGWNQNFSDFYIEDGAFFRIQNVKLAYNFNGVELMGQDDH